MSEAKLLFAKTLHGPVDIPVIDGAIVVFDGTTGRLSRSGGLIVDVNNDGSGLNNLVISGSFYEMGRDPLRYHLMRI